MATTASICCFNNRLRNLALLIFSYLFYLFGAPDFILFLAGATLFDYVMGRLMDRFKRWKRLWLTLSIVANLGLLAWFKYANFMVAQTAEHLSRMGIDLSGWGAVALPVGISFFTFQKLSYTIDVYRGRCKPIANLIDFSMYVALFPQLVAARSFGFATSRNRLEKEWNRGISFIGVRYGFVGACVKRSFWRTPAVRLQTSYSASHQHCWIPKLHGWEPLPIPCKSIWTFPRTRTWPSAWACSSGSVFWKTSTGHTVPSA